ncbi:MAG: hypothetical protein E7158_04530 [Firmicutes bacterium]|nr:hypothetical protein [Bacillota bacterium]
MNKIKFDKYQLKAIKSLKNTLLVAGAGAGKSTTIVGKIDFLLKNGYNKEEILCISFTNASVNDLKKKLKYDIDVFTFHKLSLKILEHSLKLCKLCDSELLLKVVNKYLDDILSSKKKKKKFLKYVTNIDNFKKLTLRFINLFKSNNYNEYKFQEIFKQINKIKNKNKRLSNLMYLVNIINIYKLYKIELNSTFELDFNDLIIEATKAVNTSTFTDNYKYIIIDEFQDTSLVRLNLILEIYNKNKCKVFCVGDDFQSIYQFTGCNLNIFLNFKNYFKNSNIKKLKMTYRNPQELINVAGAFVMKNKLQIKKKLISNKHINKPIKIVYLDNNNNLLKLLNIIKTSYIILGRNNKDIYKYFNNEEMIKYNIKYLTIHKSKGLEDDNIVVINLTNDFNSIPSSIKNDYLIDLLIDNSKDIYFEERRLFYVALTRTKNNVYLITNKHYESSFIKELINDYKKYIEFISL